MDNKLPAKPPDWFEGNMLNIAKKVKLSYVINIMLISISFIPELHAANLRMVDNFRFAVGFVNSGFKQQPYEHWQDNYRPPGGSMNLDTDDHALFIDFGFGVTPTLNIGKWSFGMPVYYDVTLFGSDNFTFNKTVAKITVDWWDRVPLHKVKIKKKTPAIGFSIGNKQWSIQTAFQKYIVISEDYAGDDVPDGVNRAHSIDRKTLEEGWGFRSELRLLYLVEYLNILPLSIYYEKNGSHDHQFGVLLKYSLLSHIF